MNDINTLKTTLNSIIHMLCGHDAIVFLCKEHIVVTECSSLNQQAKCQQSVCLLCKYSQMS